MDLSFLPWILIAVLSAVIIVLLLKVKSDKNRVDKLSSSIHDFLNDGAKTEFSVHDDHFSKLQNAVSDLEEIIDIEKNQIISENKKNTQFISDISHQLKTPLAALRLYCEMENSSNPNDHNEKELQLIDKMEKLVFQLLRLEKIKVDSYVMDYKYHDISEVVKKIFIEFKPMFPEKQFIIEGSSTLRMDEEWMFDALGNVIKNACEHTADNGKISVIISETQRSTNIDILDNGGGMAENEIPNLFTRFYKAENSSPNSTGIGLAITKAIIEKHHGIISAENKNDGLCVTICLPHIDGYEAI